MAPPWKLLASFLTHTQTSTGVFGLRIIKGIPKEGENIEKIEHNKEAQPHILSSVEILAAV
jgi:hypothetical protein